MMARIRGKCHRYIFMAIIIQASMSGEWHSHGFPPLMHAQNSYNEFIDPWVKDLVARRVVVSNTRDMEESRYSQSEGFLVF